jgi:hypothetical protein
VSVLSFEFGAATYFRLGEERITACALVSSLEATINARPFKERQKLANDLTLHLGLDAKIGDFTEILISATILPPSRAPLDVWLAEDGTILAMPIEARGVRGLAPYKVCTLALC